MTDTLLTAPAPHVAAPSRIKRIGHITPSSNTALEPLTYAMNRGLEHQLAHHFTRISVTHLALSASSEAQFQLERMLAAARLLADAPLDALVWNGTSASWRGLENDLRLCEAITRETGIPATTSTLAFYNAFHEKGYKTVGLALPYIEEISAQIATEYAKQGFPVTGSSSLGLLANVDIGAAEPDAIRGVLRGAAKEKPDCIAVVCTNFNATELVEEMEAELGIPIVDSIAVTFWEAARVAGVDVKAPGWGKLLAGE
ncbi:aspartate/glutamate racemase family protein [Kaistia dalseonensis]|uniref:Maleate isomerase n=1 Tax=Kaistia dalseonensis TaxID=410840 RepID=A0ABU0H3R5_9HYPH|nr:aspartate/glutamate racemase family protein [Kaistia dalseonensis]MCX5494362.1 aspartate/glutamate racemase family protein [Kaistia dalseonensis]MDQ0436944.1 maleate isomerase [Kaistia dalseonensis]